MSEAKARPLDLILTGGRLFDPASGSWRVADLGIQGGLIVAIGTSLNPVDAVRSADVAGAMVTPGLTDLHVHAYPGATFWGMEIDGVSLASGVTTVVDAGSAGPYNFHGLAKRLRTAKTRSYAYLNLAPGGLTTPYGELLAPGAIDVEAAVRVANANRDLVVGFKLRASPNTVGPQAAEALAAVRKAADETGLAVMVHVSESPPDLGMVLDHLRAGDVLTHCFTPYDNCVVASDGRPREVVLQALERGVNLDVGHGSGSFSFPAAEAWVRSGSRPAITSTDLHRRSALGPAFDMNTVMTKMLVAGCSVEEVLVSATSAPASVLKRTAVLEVGAAADIAVLELADEHLRVWDSRGVEREASTRFRCQLTVRGGEVEYVAPHVWLVGA
ncbi:MAG TPA: amidohydrolase/deacetylase family metallohydrolase [Trueperaceae bacterium]|nr:amidohydrolase/deacetylase family metallohydrolase [Trueperaceae bacterium]